MTHPPAADQTKKMVYRLTNGIVTGWIEYARRWNATAMNVWVIEN